MTVQKRLLVTGREGQVVRSLLERATLHPDIEVLALGRPEFDLSTPGTLPAVIKDLRPDVVISAAAYTAVDQAETEEELARVINAHAAGVIAETAQVLQIPIIHLSTDYVFDGNKLSAYVETDPVAPVSAYGRTKLAGEEAVAFATDNHVILRTAWVHSPFGKNFLKTMLRVAESRDAINVVTDQFGTPTSALDIADAVIAVARNLMANRDPTLRGVFHLTNSGRASWADFAEEIFKVSASLGGPFATVGRIPATDYPTPARRPANSQLDCTKLAAVHGVRLPDWAQSTKTVVGRVLQPLPASILTGDTQS
ncbi:dTDP-4-dehydrorhamnose reductase [Pararhizobium sp. LjRoot235]|uniref:dTDP-4-dehydrorhamnose reductase n=1 Tax=Pararhizobium sp. LjRoot235 TaxID=3342291 RepID=UPI003ECE8C9D